MIAERTFTTRDVIYITGFTARQLGYWAKQSLVVPSIQQSRGPGTRKIYSLSDLAQIHFIKQLKLHGWSTQKIRTAIKHLQEVQNDPDPLKSAMLFDGRGTMLALCKTKHGERILFDALSTSKQQVMWIVVEALVEQTQAVIEL